MLFLVIQSFFNCKFRKICSFPNLSRLSIILRICVDSSVSFQHLFLLAFSEAYCVFFSFSFRIFIILKTKSLCFSCLSNVSFFLMLLCVWCSDVEIISAFHYWFSLCLFFNFFNYQNWLVFELKIKNRTRI